MLCSVRRLSRGVGLRIRRISVRRDTELSLRESSERLFAHIDHGGDYDVDDVSGGGGGGDDDDDDELTTLGEQMMNYGHEMTVHDSALIFSVQVSVSVTHAFVRPSVHPSVRPSIRPSINMSLQISDETVCNILPSLSSRSVRRLFVTSCRPSPPDQ